MKTKHQAAMLTVTYFLLAFMMFPALTLAKDDTGAPVYMEIKGFTDGIGSDPGHEDEVQVEAVAHGVLQPYTLDTGVPSDQPLHKALNIFKPLDQISPYFPLWLFTGGPPEDVTFRFFKPDSSGRATHFYTILLESPRVVNYDIEKGDLIEASETVSFVYQQITWTFIESNFSYTQSWSDAAE